MKHLFLFMVMLVVFAVSVTAQNQRVSVADGTDLNVVLSDSRFQFDGFKESRVLFKNSTATSALMNFNLLTGAMMFIDEKGDTLVLSNISDILAISIDNHLFKYESKKILEVIALDKETEIELLVKRSIQFDAYKYGAYGMAAPTSSIDNVTTLAISPARFGLSTQHEYLGVNKEVRFQRKDVYYLTQGKKNRVADKKGFLKVFSKHSNAVKSYIEKEKIKFNKEQDILRLYKYCVNIQAQSKQ